MCHASYEGVAVKLRNALIAIEGYDAMSRDGAAIPIDDMIVTMGEVTYAADMFTDLMHSEATAAKVTHIETKTVVTEGYAMQGAR